MGNCFDKYGEEGLLHISLMMDEEEQVATGLFEMHMPELSIYQTCLEPKLFLKQVEEEHHTPLVPPKKKREPRPKSKL